MLERKSENQAVNNPSSCQTPFVCLPARILKMPSGMILLLAFTEYEILLCIYSLGELTQLRDNWYILSYNIQNSFLEGVIMRPLKGVLPLFLSLPSPNVVDTILKFPLRWSTSIRLEAKPVKGLGGFVTGSRTFMYLGLHNFLVPQKRQHQNIEGNGESLNAAYNLYQILLLWIQCYNI